MEDENEIDRLVDEIFQEDEQEECEKKAKKKVGRPKQIKTTEPVSVEEVNNLENIIQKELEKAIDEAEKTKETNIHLANARYLGFLEGIKAARVVCGKFFKGG